MRRPGFTLFEAALALGVIAAIAALLLPMYRNFQTRSDLQNAVQQITQSLGRARTLSIAGKGDSTWGVYTPDAVLFRGPDYARRAAAFDEMYPISPTIDVSGLEQVTYSRLTGAPSATGTVVLTAVTGERLQINILINREGIPVVAEDRVTVCHCQSNPQKTMQIPDNAWPGHKKHGDFMGACRMVPGECEKH